MAKEKTEVAVVVIKGEVFIRRDDVVRLVHDTALILPDADARHIVKELAENIAAGKVR